MRPLLFAAIAIVGAGTCGTATLAVEPRPRVVTDFLDQPAPAAAAKVNGKQLATPKAYVVQIRKFSRGGSPGFDKYLQQLDLAALKADGSGWCLIDRDHQAARLLADSNELPAGEAMISDSSPTIALLDDKIAMLRVGKEVQTAARAIRKRDRNLRLRS